MNKVGFKDQPKRGGKKIEIKFPERITKAGPPRCEQCGSIKVAWTHKFENDNSLLWICPIFCEFHKHGGT